MPKLYNNFFVQNMAVSKYRWKEEDLIKAIEEVQDRHS